MKGLEVAVGNYKIADDTIILNICAARDCPSRKLGLRQMPPGKCYADKAERQYPAVLPYRRRQEKQWDALTAQEIAERLLAGIRRRKLPTRWIRLDEAGDFRCRKTWRRLRQLRRSFGSTVRSGCTHTPPGRTWTSPAANI